MKPRLVSLAFALLASAAATFAQGSLTPPGAPAPTMKTLDQLEPRTPLGAGAPGVTQNANGGFTISAPGSYYLTGNLTVASGDGIVVGSDNVMLDLNGFTLDSTDAPATSRAIYFANAHCPINNGGIVIRNGHILSHSSVANNVFTAGPGFLDGIAAEFESPLLDSIHVENVDIVGVTRNGISGATDVRRCLVSACGGKGIQSHRATDCRVTDCVANAIAVETAAGCHGGSLQGCGLCASRSAIDCSGQSVSGTGLKAHLALRCSGLSTSGTGLDTAYDGTASGSDLGAAEGCTGSSTSGLGLNTGSAVGCLGVSQTDTGLLANLATNCRGVTATAGKYGIRGIGTATNCRGQNTADNGVAIYATIAVACTAEAGTIKVPIIGGSKQLGTP